MKLSLIMSCILTTNIFASVYSQNVRLNFEIKDQPVREVLKTIEKQSQFRFFYNDDYIDLDKKITLTVDDMSIDELLSVVLDQTNVGYRVLENNFIVITPGKMKQQQKITGTVTDATSGEPLPGVYVMIEGTKTGTITDSEGKYALEIPPQNSVLVFSYIGYIPEKVVFDGKLVVDITLVVDIQSLGEVVVIGYGTTSRQNFTGSVATLKVEDSPSALSSTTNVLSLLRGTTSGVTMTQSGEAGEVPDILIRGQKSISGGSTPLFVVDGIIFSGNLSDLDVNTIESMTVLKDATTLAAYGSKAANGVVMITTKKGKLGKPVISFNSSVAVSTIGYRPKMRDGQGYLELMNLRSGYAIDADPSWMSSLERINYNEGKTTDWLDYIDRAGILQNYSLSFSGATDYANFYLSAGHLDQKGNYYGDNYSRNTFSASVSTNVNKYIEIGANTNLAFNNYEGVSPAYSGAISISPYAEPRLLNGKMRKFVDGKEASTVNPLWSTYNGIDNETDRKTTILGGYINMKIPKVEGLSFKITGSYTIGLSETNYFVHETTFPEMSLGDNGYTTAIYDQHLVDASGYISDNKNDSWVLDNILNYTRGIGKHYINASLVYTRNSSKVESKYVSGSDFRGVGNTTLGIYGLPNAEVQEVNSYNYTLHNDIGYLARVNYSFNNKYHLNVSTRYDGSSVFGSKNKWGFFPAIGGAWTVSNENFMKNISSIDNLKLKLSWGMNGNQSLAPYGTLSITDMGRGGGYTYYINGEPVYGQTISSLGNNELGWESTTSVNYGFEVDLLKHRLHVEADGYKSTTKDQIFERTIPVMGTGLTEQYATMGQVDNWGVEIDVSSVNIDKGDFKWNTGIIFYLNRNKLVELYGDGQDDIPNSLFLGKSLGAIYGYKRNGVVQTGEENYLSNITATAGDAKYADVNGDGQLTAADRTILGYSKENFHLSMKNTFTYKNVELYILVNGIFGGNGYGMAKNNSYYLTADGYFYHNTLDHPYWTSENKNTEFPRWDYMDEKFTALQSYGFVRMQEVNLAYTFNNKLLNKYGINGMKLYLACSNVFVYSPHWEGSDPEIRNFNAAQFPRSFNFGLNVKF